MACQEHRVIAEQQAAPKEQKFSDVKDIMQCCRHETITPPTRQIWENHCQWGARAVKFKCFCDPVILFYSNRHLTTNRHNVFFQKDPVLKKQMQCTLLILNISLSTFIEEAFLFLINV